MGKFTRKNPDGTFRVPFCAVNNFRMLNDRLNGAFFGEFIDRLGLLEEIFGDKEVEKLNREQIRKITDYIKSV